MSNDGLNDKLWNVKYSKIIQLQYEADTWIRTLHFMKAENTNLKNRLAEVVKDKLNKDVLHKIESYQNSFIGEDEMISFLILNVNNYKLLLDRKLKENGVFADHTDVEQKKLRADIEKAEVVFCKIRFDFNNYLSGIL